MAQFGALTRAARVNAFEQRPKLRIDGNCRGDVVTLPSWGGIDGAVACQMARGRRDSSMTSA
jgi:hypothetical protein